MAEKREKAGPEKGSIVETRHTDYLAAGVGVDPYVGTPSLDPELEKVREAEIKANEVEVFSSFEEPTIDPELVKARKAELERDAKRAGVKLSDTSAGQAEPPKPNLVEEPAEAPAKKTATKKAAAKKTVAKKSSVNK